MTVIVETDFTSSYPPSGWGEQGTIASVGTSTLQAWTGTTSMRCNTSSQQAWIANSGRTERTLAGRFGLYLAATPSAVTSIWQGTNANGSLFIRLTTARVLRVTMNTTNFNGPTLATGQWYLIEFLAQTSGATATLDVMSDRGTAINGTLAQTAADMTAHHLGVITTSTNDLYFANFKMTDVAADHPMGALPVENPMGAQGMFGI